MTCPEIKQLLEAGFTHDEIMSFTPSTENPSPAQVEPETTGEQVEPETPVDNKVEPVPAPEVLPDYEKLTTSIEKLIKTIQASNLANASFNTKGETLEQEVDQIMSTLIRPERKENK